jgi:tetratricopeptide (TPR) repeat protein
MDRDEGIGVRMTASEHRTRATARRALQALLVCVACVGVSHGQLRHGDDVVVVEGASRVRVRSAPAFEQDGANTFIRWVTRGTPLKRISREGDWWQVLLPEGGEAYISARYARADVVRDTLIVIPTRVNVRLNPSTSADKIGTVSRNDALAMVRERNNWYLAILPDGDRRGWIRSDMVNRKPVGPAGDAARKPDAEPDAAAASATPQQPPAAPASDPFQDGLDLASEGRIEEAVASLKKAAEARPNDGAVHFELAKLLQKSGAEDEALRHFRAALKGKPARPEARFFIDAILGARADTGETPTAAPAAEAPWSDALLEGSGYLLPGIALGSVLFLVVLGVVYRRRRTGRSESRVYRRRRPDAGFDAVLKYAVEKRPLLRAVEEAERKRAELDEALSQQFQTVGKDAETGPQLPEVASAEALLKRVEDLRHTIISQEERAQIYAELVVLQNQKIEALDDEIEALKKLIQLDYAESAKGRPTDAPKGARKGTPKDGQGSSATPNRQGT